MKRILLLSVAMLGLIFSGCKKDSILPTKFKATVDGDSWSSITNVVTKGSNTITLTGTSTTGKIMNIVVFGTEAKTYTLGGGSLQFSATFSTGVTNYIASSGEVVITSLNTSTKKISGTFHFSATILLNTIQIEDGEFTEVVYKEVSQ